MIKDRPINKLEASVARSGEVQGQVCAKSIVTDASVKPCRLFKGGRHHLSGGVDAVICR